MQNTGIYIIGCHEAETCDIENRHTSYVFDLISTHVQTSISQLEQTLFVTMLTPSTSWLAGVKTDVRCETVRRCIVVSAFANWIRMQQAQYKQTGEPL